MPTFVSKDGVFHPAKERVALRNNSNETIKNPSAEYSKYCGEEVKPGEQYIYEGPDRAALFELYLQKQETMGFPFWDDPELVSRVRQLGYKDVKQYAKAMGWNKEKVEEEFVKKASVVTKHELPEKVKAIERLGGGMDTSGQGKNRYGGFGEVPQV